MNLRHGVEIIFLTEWSHRPRNALRMLSHVYVTGCRSGRVQINIHFLPDPSLQFYTPHWAYFLINTATTQPTINAWTDWTVSATEVKSGFGYYEHTRRTVAQLSNYTSSDMTCSCCSTRLVIFVSIYCRHKSITLDTTSFSYLSTNWFPPLQQRNEVPSLLESLQTFEAYKSAFATLLGTRLKNSLSLKRTSPWHFGCEVLNDTVRYCCSTLPTSTAHFCHKRSAPGS
jgi:hypothetical protein